jgi:hypothetical protein
MSQLLPYEQSYDVVEAIKTVREVLEYNPCMVSELIVLEVVLRGYEFDAAWLEEVIEKERQREDHCSIILAAYSPMSKRKCSICYANDGTITLADFVILLDICSEWKSVCKSCCSKFEWNEVTEWVTD